MSWAVLPPLVAAPRRECGGECGFADEFGVEACSSCYGLGTVSICPACQEEPRIVGGALGEVCACVHVTAQRVA